MPAGSAGAVPAASGPPCAQGWAGPPGRRGKDGAPRAALRAAGQLGCRARGGRCAAGTCTREERATLSQPFPVLNVPLAFRARARLSVLVDPACERRVAEAYEMTW